ncbi:MAG: leucine-rich repeat domain-containing protein, partial [Firmicutes bacterium]|nr:leucine-rich repeat domain-containing protein [Bacillota bacterium]
WIHENAFAGTDCRPMAFAGRPTAAKAIEMQIPLEIDFLDPADETKWQIGMYFSFHDSEYCLDSVCINPEASPVVDVVVPDGVESINERAFEGLSGITGVVLPDSLRGIGAYAFDGCSALVNMGLPDNMVWIHENAFAGTDCRPMAFAGRPTAAKAIEMQIPLEIDFLDPADETKWQLAMNLSFHDGAYCLDHAYVNADATPVTAIVLPDGIEGIGPFAFHQATQAEIDRFEAITVPASVAWIDDYAFDACTNATLLVYGGSYAETWAAANSFPHQTIAE